MYYLQRVELGYWLSEQYWSKGIVSDASKMMVKYFFSDDYTYQVNDGQPIARVDCNIYSWNKGSGNLDPISKIMFIDCRLQRK
jgi:RimJ/RimL family protein N-acetyltransferase